MRVTVISIVVGELTKEKKRKRLEELEIIKRIKTIQIREFFKSATEVRKVLKS